MLQAFVIIAFASIVGQGSTTETAKDRRQDAFAPERRIIQYIKDNWEPGQPLVLSELYNEVFTTPEERAALSRLNNTFFRMPVFLAEYQTREGALPTLDEIADQFGFDGPEPVDVLLSVMESDPRMPTFLTRDPDTGALLDLDVETIRSDPELNSGLGHSLDWGGRVLPNVGGVAFDGSEISLAGIAAQAVLLYVWFTDCPPCVRMAPELVALQKQFGERGFTVLGANVDGALGLPYSDADRSAYAEANAFNFPNFQLSQDGRDQLGNVNIFPTMFLVGADRVVIKYYVNYQARDVLAEDIEAALLAIPSRSD